MKKLILAIMIAAIAIPAQAWYVPPVVVVPPVAVVPPPPPPPPAPPPPAGPVGHAASPALAWGAGSILGIAAVLSGYDFARRWFCIGDPWHLGGPGFSEPMPRHGNVKSPPACGRKVLRVRG